MKNDQIITRQFKKIDDTYAISEYGDVMNIKTGKILKPAKTADGHYRVDMHGRHSLIHREVFKAWGDRPLKQGEQVNHKDDCKENNHISNLYAGTQKDNIADCIKNGNRRGNTKSLIIRDKVTNEILTFKTSRDFFKVSGHNASNGSVAKATNRDWFKKQYDLLYFGHKKISELNESVTTNPDECTGVGRN